MPSGSITEEQINKAIMCVSQSKSTKIKIVQDLIQLLEENQDDGAFNGSFESAIACLENEGFEVELDN